MSTQLFLTDVASSVTTGTETKKLARPTTRGAGLVSKVTNTGASPPIQLTDGAGGNAITWYTEPVAAITISGTVTINLWGLESAAQANTGLRVRIERCNNAGTVLSTILNSARGVELGTAAAVQNWTATPTSTSLAAGDRLKITVLGDGVGTMGNGRTFTVGYGLGSAGANGDAYVTLTETLAPGFISAAALSATGRIRAGSKFWAMDWADLWAINASTDNNLASGSPAELQASTVTSFAAKGLKLFRVSFRWTYMQPTLFGALDAAYLERVLYSCRSAANNGAKVIVDCHQVGAQYNGLFIGSVGLPYTALRDFWSRLTTALKADATAWSAVWALEIMNEPGQTDGSWLGDHTVAGSGYRAGIQGVRDVDANVRILVSGEGYTNCTSWFSVANNNNMVLPDANCIITGHQYFDGSPGAGNAHPGNYRASASDVNVQPNPTDPSYYGMTPTAATDLFQYWLSFLVTKGYQGFVSEFGVPSRSGTGVEWMAILQAVMALLDGHPNVLGGSTWTSGGSGIGDESSWIYNGSQGIPIPNNATRQANAHWNVLGTYPTGSFGATNGSAQAEASGAVLAATAGLTAVPAINPFGQAIMAAAATLTAGSAVNQSSSSAPSAVVILTAGSAQSRASAASLAATATLSADASSGLLPVVAEQVASFGYGDPAGSPASLGYGAPSVRVDLPEVLPSFGYGSTTGAPTSLGYGGRIIPSIDGLSGASLAATGGISAGSAVATSSGAALGGTAGLIVAGRFAVSRALVTWAQLEVPPPQPATSDASLTATASLSAGSDQTPAPVASPAPLSAVAALTAGSLATGPSGASLAAAAVLSAGSIQAEASAASLTATATLGAGSMTSDQRAAPLEAVAGLTAGSLTVALSGAGLTATADLTAGTDSTLNLGSVVAMTADGTLTAAGLAINLGGALLGATATLTAAGGVPRHGVALLGRARSGHLVAVGGRSSSLVSRSR